LALQDKYLTLLKQRTEDGSYRELSEYSGLVDFWSNDYLGAAKVPLVGSGHHGSTGSRLISGHSKLHETCEVEFATFFNQEAGLLYNSGYDANLGLFSCLPQRGDTIIYDEYCHASIRDGIRLSNARNFSFKHNDVASLKEKLTQASGEIFIAVESIYSMDGDIAPLQEIVKLSQEFNAKIIVDEAHSAGVVGKHGVGLVSDLKLDEAIFAKVITLGKAFGLHGAFILGNQSLRSYLINFSRSFIYTTAPSEYHVSCILQRLQWIKSADAERLQLKSNMDMFSKSTNLPCNSPIFNVTIGSINKAKSLAKLVIENGFACKAILSPTVPKGEECVRICIHSYNTEKQLVSLSETLKQS
jgi:8-amino-7-oxononanoate synthase